MILFQPYAEHKYHTLFRNSLKGMKTAEQHNAALHFNDQPKKVVFYFVAVFSKRNETCPVSSHQVIETLIKDCENLEKLWKFLK